MPRVTVWVPDELHARARSECPDLNWSATMQFGIAAALDCEHHSLVCRRCASGVDVEATVGEAVSSFLFELLQELTPLVWRTGTAEGACRVIKRLAVDRGLPCAGQLPQPRPAGKRRRPWAA